MNHAADRERLAKLLAEIDDEVDSYGNGYTFLHSLINRARAIVDAPNYGPTDAEIIENYYAEHGHPEFFNEPVHEYAPAEPGVRRVGIRGTLGVWAVGAGVAALVTTLAADAAPSAPASTTTTTPAWFQTNMTSIPTAGTHQEDAP